MTNLKLFIKNLLIKILTDVSIRKVKLHDPIVIGVTGNVGKTSTKDYIFTVLDANSEVNAVRASEKSYNSEIGIPLTILGEENKWGNLPAWIYIIIKHYILHFVSKYLSFIYSEDYPAILVLEVGADGPGNISAATKMFSPDIVVLTAFAEHPVHMEYFKTREDFVCEKKVLVDALKDTGTVIYNADDVDMTKMAMGAKVADKRSYGKNGKDVKLSMSTFLYEDAQGGEKKLLGSKILFTLNNIQYTVKLEGVIGISHAYAMLAAICVADLFELPMDMVVESLTHVTYPKSRLRIFNGLNDSTIIDDTYNASPKAMTLALDTMRSLLTRGKKIVILGHMAELGIGSDIEHRKIGMQAAESTDKIIFIGRHNEWYLEGVRETRFDLDNVYLAKDAAEAIEIFQNNIALRKEDIVLLKGSQSARVEKVAVTLLKDREDKDQICRQESEWGNR